MTDTDSRAAARFISDVWRHEKARLYRRPRADECVIAAYALASQIIDNFIGDRITFLGGPRGARNAFATLAGGRARPSAQLTDQAETALRYLTEVGDLATAKPASVEMDRKVMCAHAEHFRRYQEINDSEVGRRVRLSHSQARDRRLARSLRILRRLHQDFPDLWSDKLRPVIDPMIQPDEKLAA
jgi:hypothetical protein